MALGPQSKMSNNYVNVVVTHTDKQAKFHRLNVKVVKSGTIKDILEQSCQQVGLADWQQYQIIHGKMPLQNSTLLRLSGLLPGAKLELVPKRGQSTEQSIVCIAVQCDTGRATLQVPSTSTLFFILTALQERFPLYQIKNDGLCEPLMVVMGQEYFGLEVLMKNRLIDLGIGSGNCLIRFSYRKSVYSLEDIQAIIQKTTDPCVAATPPKSPMEESKNDQVEAEQAIVSTISPPPSSQTVEAADSASIRNVRIITPSLSPNTSVLPTAPNLPDSYYEMNEMELKSYYSSIQRQTRSLLDAPLISKTKLNAKLEQEFLANHPQTIIRFRFPSERRLIEVTFDSVEAISELFTFVRKECIVPNSSTRGNVTPFELFTSPPKRILKDCADPIWKCNLTPASIVNVSFKCEDQSLLINPQVFNSHPNIQNTITSSENVASTAATAPSKSSFMPAWLPRRK